MTARNPAVLLPELLILGAAVLGLMIGLWSPRDRQGTVAVVCATGLVAAMATAGLAALEPARTAFDALEIDPITHTVRFAVAASALAVVGLAGRLRGHPRETELYVLVLLASLGTITMAAAGDLLVLMAAYLLASIPGYALAGFAKDARGTEAALKYYLMGALLGIVMLSGTTVLYGAARATAYRDLAVNMAAAPQGAVAAGTVALLAGILFKAGAVPAQYWVPDVTEGAPSVVAAFVTTVPKLGALAAAFRLADEVLAAAETQWRLLVAVLAAATMTLGNFAAFGQSNVRRLLAYSTISQAGYLLVPVAVAGRSGLAEPALLFYLAAYAVTNLGAFAVVIALGREDLAGYRGLGRRSPWQALSLTICLLGLIGTPPTAVFVGKVLVFGTALGGGFTWLAVVMAVNTVASVFYYLRWIAPLYARAEPPEGIVRRDAAVIAGSAALLSVAMGITSGVVLATG